MRAWSYERLHYDAHVFFDSASGTVQVTRFHFGFVMGENCDIVRSCHWTLGNKVVLVSSRWDSRILEGLDGLGMCFSDFWRRSYDCLAC